MTDNKNNKRQDQEDELEKESIKDLNAGNGLIGTDLLTTDELGELGNVRDNPNEIGSADKSDPREPDLH
ncbi:MAG: hypothetical protein JWN76_1554 [Chitinophagaceae bacterium]|nr:hypothetical protein [Chitinophagaceae bacterium]